jgi:c-di-GMP-binding flagellar brake protein YcgR
MFSNVFKGGLQRFQDRRRAARIVEPAVVAYYWDGSVPLPHRVRDISRAGIYLYTGERWYPGTILNLTLDTEQIGTGEMAANTPVESITLWSKVVRHGSDGVGLEFILVKPDDREKLVHLLGVAKRGISEQRA